MKHHQRGISLIGILFVGGVLACAGLLLVQAIPTFLEYRAIIKAVNKAKEGSTVADVRAIFDRAATIDNVSSISGKDLDVSKQGDKTVVAFAYTREIHMAGPAFLLFKYDGRSK